MKALLTLIMIYAAVLALFIVPGAVMLGCSEEEIVSRFDSLSVADQAEVEYGCSNPTFTITSCDDAFDKDRCLQARYDRCLETYVPWR